MAKKKHKKLFGLEKLPTKAYIKALEERVKELQIQQGKDTSYIQELEDTLDNLNKLPKEELVKLNYDKQVEQFEKTIEKLEFKVFTITKDNKKHIAKIIELNNKLKAKEDE